jgi:hypothetical protein
MRRESSLFVLFVLTLLGPAVIFACVGDDPAVVQDPPPTSDAASPSSSEAAVADAVNNEASVDAGEVCNAPDYNLAGCICATKGAAIPCFQGVPGPKSACNTAGTQQCGETAGGGNVLRWSACNGGGMPKSVDECHDDIDGDCNGKVDQNCACSPDVDLCRPNAIASADAGTTPTYDPNAYTMFTIPPNPKANVPFELYIVTKNRPLQAPGLLKNGAICYGGGLSRPCRSVGAGCDGWKVGFFRGVTEAAGSYDFAIKDPQGPTGCEGPTIAVKTVVVSN